MDEERLQRIQRILLCTESLTHGFNPSRHLALMQCDLTMPQLKALIFVSRNNGATSGQIANRLGVGLSTITGIVDRLAEQVLVTRHEDPRDRRITRVLPTERGQHLVEEMFEIRDEHFRKILSQLDEAQLATVESAFYYLNEAVNKLSNQTSSQEAVA
jgi:DNA-binding MarR family transcriptional regulator